MMKTFIRLLVLQSLFFYCEGDIGSLRTLQSLGNVVRFELINGITQKKISDLYNKVVIDMSTITDMTEPSFNVRAILSGGAAAVVFDYQTTLKFHTDVASPYTLCPNATCSNLTFGTHTVRATTYSSTSLKTSGKSFSLSFEIRRSSPSVLPVTGLHLIDANVSPNKVVMGLKLGATNVVDLGKLGLSYARFNIQAITSNVTQSVKFSNGVVETSKPLAYCGNSGDTFFVCNDLVVGVTKNITVTGYSQSGATGIPYTLQWAVIQIVKPVISNAPVACTIPKVSHKMHAIKNAHIDFSADANFTFSILLLTDTRQHMVVNTLSSLSH